MKYRSSHPLMSLVDQKDVFLHDLQTSPPLSGLKAELSHWEQLIFSFDADSVDAMNPYNNDHHNGSGSNNSRSNNPGGARRARPSGSGRQSSNTGPTPEEALLLAQLSSSHRNSPQPFNDASYAALMQSFQHNPNPYGPSSMMPHNFDSQLPGVDQLMNAVAGPSWGSLPPLVHHQSSHHGGNPPGPPFYNQQSSHFSSPPSPFASTVSPPSGLATATSAGSGGSSSAGSPEGLDDVGAEEKRRRNTAASARFRIKKKQKALNLERSVADLTGRADELEKEAADLRRENGWLREIVTMKSSRVHELREATMSTEPYRSASPAPPAGRNVVHIEPYESAREESSSEEEGGRRRKGKGKAKPAPKKSNK
ncbi:hypothetical protein BD626DRAFT_486451 [Schizophyllum amplum]|uniref:BZIP domain-containing protein n=1 Tax=Schizophyllum amplum TaxID=97359 RepID=A0A550CMG5_9AGAR|nr:hypothetical protein BD626DRAFT_486451 [Auriculariopsis ampla]